MPGSADGEELEVRLAVVDRIDEFLASSLR